MALVSSSSRFHHAPLLLAGTVLVISSLLGCNLRKHSKAEREDTKVSSTEIHSATVDKRGLDAEGNDPKLVALAKSVLTDCTPSSSSSSSSSSGSAASAPLFDRSCATFKKLMDLPDLKDGPYESTFVSFLEDANHWVRYMGIRGLSQATAYQTNRALSTRIVAVASVEQSKELLDPLGDVVAHINVAKTNLLASITDIIMRREQPDLCISILDRLLFTNSSHRGTYDFFVSMTNDPDTRFRSKALRAFWVAGSLSKPETCKVWEAHLDDADESIAGHSTLHLGWYHACSSSYEKLLTSLESRVNGKRLGSTSDFGTAPGKMCQDTGATLAQKQRGAAISRTIASNKELHDFLRGDAIRSVVECDPQGGRAFVARFKNDKASFVRSAVTDALKPARK